MTWHRLCSHLDDSGEEAAEGVRGGWEQKVRVVGCNGQRVRYVMDSCAIDPEEEV